jgi:hypothetical protein
MTGTLSAAHKQFSLLQVMSARPDSYKRVRDQDFDACCYYYSESADDVAEEGVELRRGYQDALEAGDERIRSRAPDTEMIEFLRGLRHGDAALEDQQRVRDCARIILALAARCGRIGLLRRAAEALPELTLEDLAYACLHGATQCSLAVDEPRPDIVCTGQVALVRELVKLVKPGEFVLEAALESSQVDMRSALLIMQAGPKTVSNSFLRRVAGHPPHAPGHAEAMEVMKLILALPSANVPGFHGECACVEAAAAEGNLHMLALLAADQGKRFSAGMDTALSNALCFHRPHARKVIRFLLLIGDVSDMRVDMLVSAMMRDAARDAGGADDGAALTTVLAKSPLFQDLLAAPTPQVHRAIAAYVTRETLASVPGVVLRDAWAAAAVSL